MLDFLLQKKQKQTKTEAKHKPKLTSKKNQTLKEATKTRQPEKDGGKLLTFPVYPFYATLRDKAETLPSSSSLQARGFSATKTNIRYVAWGLLAEQGLSKEDVLLQKGKAKKTKDKEQAMKVKGFSLDPYKSRRRKREQEKPKQNTLNGKPKKNNPYLLIRGRVGGPTSQLNKTKNLLGFGKILAKRKKSPGIKAQNNSEKKDKSNQGEAFKIQQEHKIELELIGRKKISKESKVKTKTRSNPKGKEAKHKRNNFLLSQKLGNSYPKKNKELTFSKNFVFKAKIPNFPLDIFEYKNAMLHKSYLFALPRWKREHVICNRGNLLKLSIWSNNQNTKVSLPLKVESAFDLKSTASLIVQQKDIKGTPLKTRRKRGKNTQNHMYVNNPRKHLVAKGKNKSCATLVIIDRLGLLRSLQRIKYTFTKGPQEGWVSLLKKTKNRRNRTKAKNLAIFSNLVDIISLNKNNRALVRKAQVLKEYNKSYYINFKP